MGVEGSGLFNVIWLKSIHSFTFIVTVFTASASICVSSRNASLYIAVMIFCAQPYLKPCFMCPFYILSTCPSKGLCTALELCVISIEVVGEAMCLYDGSQWCSVCGEEEGSKNRSLGNPSDQFMCFGYLPSPGHLERPTSEIGFKPAKWNPSDIQWWEGGQEDLMIDSVKSGREIQQNEDWWFGIGFCNSQGFSDR